MPRGVDDENLTACLHLRQTESRDADGIDRLRDATLLYRSDQHLLLQNRGHGSHAVVSRHSATQQALVISNATSGENTDHWVPESIPLSDDTAASRLPTMCLVPHVFAAHHLMFGLLSREVARHIDARHRGSGSPVAVVQVIGGDGVAMSTSPGSKTLPRPIHRPRLSTKSIVQDYQSGAWPVSHDFLAASRFGPCRRKACIWQDRFFGPASSAA